MRTADPGDHRAISRLFGSSYSVLMRDHYDPALLEAALPLITRANPILLASGTFFVARTAAGFIAGCGGWTRTRPGRGGTTPGLGYMRHFATHPAYTRLGIGRAVYDACEEQALAGGITRFQCYASLGAEGFYVALGFEAIEHVCIEVGRDTKLPAVRMERAIA